MGWIIEALGLDLTRQHQGFAHDWQVTEVRILMIAGEDVGWMQAAPVEDTVFLKQLYLAARFHRRGIGSRVIQALIEEAGTKPVTLAVVKINPARRLYERLGFHITHEDQYKFYMRREPDPSASPLFP
jgi:GNAT superfamily N-acetyltransferase